MRGLQRAGVAACAKHFPGHGDTSVDSHLALPLVDSLDPRALEPFRAAIAAGVRSLMTAHIVVRSIGDEPATMSREVLHDLLRVELGFDGVVVTDALEMKAISETVGVEEGAVRSIAAGADALCLGHDLFDDSVVAVRDALVGAVRSGRLPEGRLVEAAGRVAALARPSAGATANRDVGRDAARRALRLDGGARIDGPALVVELVPEVGMAAGRLSQLPGEWFQAVVPDAEVRRFEREPGRSRARRPAARRHRARRAPARVGAGGCRGLTARDPSAIVVEIGLPHWRPPRAGTYVATYGAARVNVESAAEALYSRPRRGVEQSGSSPGS